MEYESETAGTLLQILVAEGETAPIGAPIARIGAPGETPEPTSNTVLQAQSAAGEAPNEPSNTMLQSSKRPPRVNASPIAKRLAEQHGIDLSTLQGTGPNGAVSKEDVERAVAGGEAAGGDRTPEPLTRVQQVIARHMVEAAGVPTFAVEV